MSPETPSDPQEGKAGEPEQIEAEAAAAKDAPKDAPEAEDAPQADAQGEASAEKDTPKEEAAEAPPEEAAQKLRGRKAAKAPEEPERRAEVKGAPRKGAPRPPRRRVVRARARYVRTSARKARMVCGHLRGKTVQEARAILAFTPRDAARSWSKLLESAVANAESNHELLEDDLIVLEAYADEGPTIKRFRPRALGRATPIRKRTSHLTITLTPGP
jgi:large subunit ribosomal protein L22